jgi:hypothetical protein
MRLPGTPTSRAGIEFQGLLAGRNQLLLEYFRGHSPNGQFYKEKIDYVGLGLHFNFYGAAERWDQGPICGVPPGD